MFLRNGLHVIFLNSIIEEGIHYYNRTIFANIKFNIYSFMEEREIDKPVKENFTEFELKKIDSVKDNSDEMERIRNYNKERNFTIALSFGLIGGVLGAIIGGFAGFIIGAIIGVIVGFVLKSILD